jgi:hypothetical protein
MTRIDRFLLSRLQSQVLEFSTSADRAALIRRAAFDLIGLSPSPEDVQSFVSDGSPDAYDRCTCWGWTTSSLRITIRAATKA